MAINYATAYSKKLEEHMTRLLALQGAENSSAAHPRFEKNEGIAPMSDLSDFYFWNYTLLASLMTLILIAVKEAVAV